jgi:hypothetical protein
MKHVPQLRINKEFQYLGKATELVSELQRISKLNWFKSAFRVAMLGKWEYELTSKISFGTILSFWGGGIYCNLQFQDPYKNQNNPTLIISTDTRVEHYVILGLFLLFYILIGTTQVILAMLALQLLAHLWFHWIYRIQENKLIAKIQSAFELTEKKEDNMH